MEVLEPLLCLQNFQLKIISSPAKRSEKHCVFPVALINCRRQAFAGAALDQADIERVLGGPPRLSVEEIVDHPRISEARKVFLDRFLALYSGDPFTVRLLIESGRFLVYHLAGVLDAAAEPDRRETWFTITRLKQHLKLFGMASDRHIDLLIARLCSAGFLDIKPAVLDRRVRILKPTERLKAHDRDWLVAHISPLDFLYPQHNYQSIMRHDLQFHALFRRVSMSFTGLGASFLQALPDSLLFFNHAAGAVIQAELLRLAMAAPDYPNAIISYSDIGERFGVSRTHVRGLLVAAEAAGLVRLHTAGGRRVEITSRQWASYDRGMAVGMYLHDLIYVATERAAQQGLAFMPASNDL